MKIEKPGVVIPTPKPEWWINYPLECGNCHGVFKLESSDSPKIETERCIDGYTTLEIKCPTEGCSRILSVRLKNSEAHP